MRSNLSRGATDTDFVRALRAEGFEKSRVLGDHELYKHPTGAAVSIPRGRSFAPREALNIRAKVRRAILDAHARSLQPEIA